MHIFSSYHAYVTISFLIVVQYISISVKSMCSKEEVQSKINSKEYSLRKRDILPKDVDSGKTSAIWLFMRHIYAVKEGEPIRRSLRPLKNFLAAPDGVVLSKSSGTGSIRNYLGKCKSLSEEDMDKYFKNTRDRNDKRKRQREDNTGQKKLFQYGIELTPSKRIKVDNLIPGAVIEQQVAKLIKSEIQTAQLKLINEGLLCPSFQEKASFIEILQLFTALGARTKTNFNVKDFLFSRKQITRQNIKEYGEIFERKKQIIQHAARNKCLNLQADL